MTWDEFAPRCFTSESYPVICDSELSGDVSVDKVLLALTGFHEHLLTRLKTNQQHETLRPLCATRTSLNSLFTLQILDFIWKMISFRTLRMPNVGVIGLLAKDLAKSTSVYQNVTRRSFSLTSRIQASSEFIAPASVDEPKSKT